MSPSLGSALVQIFQDRQPVERPNAIHHFSTSPHSLHRGDNRVWEDSRTTPHAVPRRLGHVYLRPSSRMGGHDSRTVREVTIVHAKAVHHHGGRSISKHNATISLPIPTHGVILSVRLDRETDLRRRGTVEPTTPPDPLTVTKLAMRPGDRDGCREGRGMSSDMCRGTVRVPRVLLSSVLPAHATSAKASTLLNKNIISRACPKQRKRQWHRIVSII